MDNNKQMTAEESLALIAEVLNNSRRSLLKDSARHFLIWGLCIAVFSLAVYLMWTSTRNVAWNWLWFGITPAGYLGVWLTGRNKEPEPKSEIGRMMSMVWATYGVFCVGLALVSVVVPLPIVLLVVLLLGIAESMSGVLLRSWPVAIAGFILGVGGIAMGKILSGESQVLLVALGGLLLLVTGIAIKLQQR